MKFDKESVIVIAVAVLFLAGWWYFTSFSKKDAVAENNQGLLVSTVPVADKVANPAVKTPEVPAASVEVPAVETKEVYPEQKLENELAAFYIDPASGSVVKSIFFQYKHSADKKKSVEFVPGDPAVRSFALVLPAPWKLAKVEKVNADKGAVTLQKIYSDGKNLIRLTQIFSLAPSSYSLKCVYSLVNLSASPVVLSRLVLWNAGLPPLKYLAGDTLYNDPHNIEFCHASAKKLTSVSPSSKEEKFKKAAVSSPVDWIGTSNKYFASLFFPVKPFDGGFLLTRVAKPMPEDPEENYFVPSVGGVYNNVTLLANVPYSLEASCYTGPKSVEEIKKLPESAIGVLHLSYFSFMEFLARPLVVFLKYLKEWCGSYGIAIILLTIIVRVVFWPVTQKANNSMRKMQKVGPMVKELKEKYKDNPQLMNQKMMELYRKEGVNPLGGCLPILLQIPVFLALYSALDASVELRHVSFLWATDLTKPDLVGPRFLFGYGIHPLILIMTALMVWQQKMTPSTGADPMQQKMMMFMPIIMLVMLYNLPSGLTLYWTVSQIFSILQMKYTQYIAKREEEKEAASSTSKPA
ncbi:MAG: membrane protein insertase YidC [Lentisphaeria bacterium]|nr:membrane protein insertase YidC [Lentisphaeria bacterium]